METYIMEVPQSLSVSKPNQVGNAYQASELATAPLARVPSPTHPTSDSAGCSFTGQLVSPEPTVNFQNAERPTALRKYPYKFLNLRQISSLTQSCFLFSINRIPVTAERAAHLFNARNVDVGTFCFVKDSRTPKFFLIKMVEPGKATINEVVFGELEGKVYVLDARDKKASKFEDLGVPVDNDFFQTSKLEPISLGKIHEKQFELSILNETNALWADQALQKQSESAYFIRPSSSHDANVVVRFKYSRYYGESALSQDRVKMLYDDTNKELYFQLYQEDGSPIVLANEFVKGFAPANIEGLSQSKPQLVPVSSQDVLELAHIAINRRIIDSKLGDAFLTSVHGTPVDSARANELFRKHIDTHAKEYENGSNPPNMLPFFSSSFVFDNDKIFFVMVCEPAFKVKRFGVNVTVEQREVQFWKDSNNTNDIYISFTDSNRKEPLHNFLENIKPLSNRYFESEKLVPISLEQLTYEEEEKVFSPYSPLVSVDIVDRADEALSYHPKGTFFIRPIADTEGEYFLTINAESGVERKRIKVFQDSFNNELYFYFLEENKNVLAKTVVKNNKPIYCEGQIFEEPTKEISIYECLEHVVKTSPKNFMLQGIHGRPFRNLEQAEALLKAYRTKTKDFIGVFMVCLIPERDAEDAKYIITKEKSSFVLEAKINSYKITTMTKQIFGDEICFKTEGREEFYFPSRFHKPLGEEDFTIKK